jgi:hypothetical protein
MCVAFFAFAVTFFWQMKFGTSGQAGDHLLWGQVERLSTGFLVTALVSGMAFLDTWSRTSPRIQWDHPILEDQDDEE